MAAGQDEIGSGGGDDQAVRAPIYREDMGSVPFEGLDELASVSTVDFDKFVGQSEGSTKENTILNNTISTSKFDDLENKIGKEVNRKIIYNIDSSKGEKVVEVKGTAFNFSFNESDTSNSAFVKYLNNKGKYLAGLGKDGSSLFLKEIIDQLPKVMFILLPLFALILKLIYFRNKIR